jgi:hypothetical protein
MKDRRVDVIIITKMVIRHISNEQLKSTINHHGCYQKDSGTQSGTKHFIRLIYILIFFIAKLSLYFLAVPIALYVCWFAIKLFREKTKTISETIQDGTYIDRVSDNRFKKGYREEIKPNYKTNHYVVPIAGTDRFLNVYMAIFLILTSVIAISAAYDDSKKSQIEDNIRSEIGRLPIENKIDVISKGTYKMKNSDLFYIKNNKLDSTFYSPVILYDFTYGGQYRMVNNELYVSVQVTDSDHETAESLNSKKINRKLLFTKFDDLEIPTEKFNKFITAASITPVPADTTLSEL